MLYETRSQENWHQQGSKNSNKKRFFSISAMLNSTFVAILLSEFEMANHSYTVQKTNFNTDVYIGLQCSA